MWVVLRHENEYDQHGGYFVAVCPDQQDCRSPNGHWGRKDDEHTWYTAKRVIPGVLYDEHSSVHRSYDSE